jgi:hypothetical protein
LATSIVGINIIGQYTCLGANNDPVLTPDLDSNATQTELKNIFWLSRDLNHDL